MQETKPLRSYGRIKGRTLKPRQAVLLETLLPRIALNLSGPIDLDAMFPPPFTGEVSSAQRETEGALGSAPSDRFAITSPVNGGGKTSLVLEIGFGGGEHLVAQAAANPEARFIGVEPFLNGVASCLRHIEEAYLSGGNGAPLPLEGGGLRSGPRLGEDRSRSNRSDEGEGVRGDEVSGLTTKKRPREKEGCTDELNIRLHMGDARDLLARLPNASLDLVYILFPDPWPKARHHKRRLIQPAFIEELARVLKPGGEIRFATDWKAYAAWTLELFLKNSDFTWAAECAADWREPWPGHTPTRYEQKRLGDTATMWFRFTHAGE